MNVQIDFTGNSPTVGVKIDDKTFWFRYYKSDEKDHRLPMHNLHVRCKYNETSDCIVLQTFSIPQFIRIPFDLWVDAWDEVGEYPEFMIQ